jgi:hypothetical protein
MTREQAEAKAEELFWKCEGIDSYTQRRILIADALMEAAQPDPGINSLIAANLKASRELRAAENRILSAEVEKNAKLTAERDELKYRLQAWDDAHAENGIDWRERYERLAEAARPLCRVPDLYRDEDVVFGWRGVSLFTIGDLRKVAAELKP